MENNPDRFSVIARSRKQVARPHASRARCDPPISARRSPSSRHLAPINAQLQFSYLTVPLRYFHHEPFILARSNLGDSDRRRHQCGDNVRDRRFNVLSKTSSR
ncbi:hypothetical protein EVAR_9394_1 [Eumeta japonica]|uniref:Uncharacterized protein n=1 Tax=Eumeta variegata TaxID=151549 RepID=A0A4C1UEB7_EUMVA|nr:hypothetical protein EVAR_9394_1 [Eumeta japonica]